MKVARNQNSHGPALSKNASCEAKVIIKIKLSTKDTAKRDPFIKVNMNPKFKFIEETEVGCSENYSGLRGQFYIENATSLI